MVTLLDSNIQFSPNPKAYKKPGKNGPFKGKISKT
jgi:hypothetical protein